MAVLEGNLQEELYMDIPLGLNSDQTLAYDLKWEPTF
jgi:hypothetical protein